MVNILTMFFHILNVKILFKNLKGYTKQDFMHIFLKDIYLFGLKNILNYRWPWIFEEIN